MSRPAQVKTRYAAIDAALLAEIESAGAWLGPYELSEFARLGDAGRRSQWLAGRWVARQLIRAADESLEMNQLQILTRDERGLGIRPQILYRANELPWVLSISHTKRGVLAALAPSTQYSVGVDLTDANLEVNEGFRGLWFDSLERQWVGHDPAPRAARLWAIKEAVYKAVHSGQAWNPRQVVVRPRGAAEFACAYRGHALDDLSLGIDEIDGQIAVVACLRAQLNDQLGRTISPIHALS